MIRNDAEYKVAVQRLADEQSRLKQQRAKLAQLKLNKEEIKRVLDPIRSFHAQLKEEVESYERLKQGEFAALKNFAGLGRLMIALRIAQGVSQRDLAERLGVHESQISRDERNEYHGVTVERAGKILEALGAELQSHVAARSASAGAKRKPTQAAVPIIT